MPEVKRLALIIAADADSAHASGLRLNAAGFETIESGETRDGLRSAVEHVPDVIVLDVDMREMDGRSALCWLRAQRETRSIPVVLVFDGTVSQHEKNQIAVEHWVARPLASNHLVTSVNQAMDESRNIDAGPKSFNKQFAQINRDLAATNAALTRIAAAARQLDCREGKRRRTLRSNQSQLR